MQGSRRRRIFIRQLAAVVVLALLLTAVVIAVRSQSGGDQPKPVRLPAATADGGEPASHVSFLRRLIPAPAAKVSGPVAPRSIQDLARRLPLDRAVAQLFLFGFNGKDATAAIFKELQRLDIGGLVVDGRNYAGAQQLAGLTAQLAATATHAAHLPPWVLAEQDGGDYSQFDDLPPTRPPGGFAHSANAAAAFAEAATTLEALGVNGLLEPSLDVAGEGSAIGDQAFSSDPTAVADYARRTVAICLQLKLFCAAKHFPGVGSAATLTDEGPAQIALPMSQLMSRDVVPFQAAIEARIPGVVVGAGLYETDDFVTPAALSQKIIDGVLRKRLRFGGLALTDDLADPGTSAFAQVPDAAVQAIKAGADLVYISGALSDQEAAYTAVLNAVRGGDIPESRVREALLRGLLTKRAYGLLLQSSG